MMMIALYKARVKGETVEKQAPNPSTDPTFMV
jgi:hypothetical protein